MLFKRKAAEPTYADQKKREQDYKITQHLEQLRRDNHIARIQQHAGNIAVATNCTNGKFDQVARGIADFVFGKLPNLAEKTVSKNILVIDAVPGFNHRDRISMMEEFKYSAHFYAQAAKETGLYDEVTIQGFFHQDDHFMPINTTERFNVFQSKNASSTLGYLAIGSVKDIGTTFKGFGEASQISSGGVIMPNQDAVGAWQIAVPGRQAQEIATRLRLQR